MHLWELEQMTSPVKEPIRFEHLGELMQAVTPSRDDLERALTGLAQNVTPTPDPLMIGWSWTQGNGGSQWPEIYPDLLTVWGVVHGEAAVTAWCVPINQHPSNEQEVRGLLTEFGCRVDRVMLPEPLPGEVLKMLDAVGEMVRTNADAAARTLLHPPAHWPTNQLDRWPVWAIMRAMTSTLDQFINMIRDREWSTEIVMTTWQADRYSSQS